jgi:hypothetical protein
MCLTLTTLLGEAFSCEKVYVPQFTSSSGIELSSDLCLSAWTGIGYTDAIAGIVREYSGDRSGRADEDGEGGNSELEEVHG